jgi:hypothetical protein
MIRYAIIAGASFLLGVGSMLAVPVAQGQANTASWCLPYQDPSWNVPGTWMGTGDIPDEAIRAYNDFIQAHELPAPG